MKTSLSRNLTSLTRSITLAFLYCALVLPTHASLTLDPTFAGGGKLTIAFPDSSTGYSSSGLKIFVQPSGRIIAGGSFTHSAPEGLMPGVAMVGITSGGTVDPTYGTGGVVLDWQPFSGGSLIDAFMYADGRTLKASPLANGGGVSSVRAVRLSVDGSVDGGFSSNASIGAGSGTARPVQISVRDDGKIVALIVESAQFYVYRLSPDGARDTTFGVNGVVQIRFNKILMPPHVNMEMMVLNDGRIVLVGHVPPVNFPNGFREFFVARLTESGHWDKTFGRAGFVRTAFGPGLIGYVTGAILQPDGKILLCGQVNSSDSDAWMARFKPNGRLDMGFGTSGIAISDFTPGGIDGARSVAVSSDGKIRLVGANSPSGFLVARFTAGGSLEESMTLPFAPDYAVAEDVAIQPDGKLVVIGYTKNPDPMVNGDVFAIARLTE